MFWHTGLLHKIAASGVFTSSTNWLRSYLDNRLIRLRGGSILSAEKSISAGVPKGSHFGPILFIVFINDLQKEVECPTEIYADDALIYQEENLKNGKTQKPVSYRCKPLFVMLNAGLQHGTEGSGSRRLKL